VLWKGASLVHPSALRNGHFGELVATHDVSVSRRSRDQRGIHSFRLLRAFLSALLRNEHSDVST